MRVLKEIAIAVLGVAALGLIIGGGNLAVGVHVRPRPLIAYTATVIGTECWALLFIWATREELKVVQFVLAALLLWPPALAVLTLMTVGNLQLHVVLFLGTIAVTLLLNLVGYKRYFRMRVRVSSART